MRKTIVLTITALLTSQGAPAFEGGTHALITYKAWVRLMEAKPDTLDRWACQRDPMRGWAGAAAVLQRRRSPLGRHHAARRCIRADPSGAGRQIQLEAGTESIRGECNAVATMGFQLLRGLSGQARLTPFAIRVLH
jgi:hypothetical protein